MISFCLFVSFRSNKEVSYDEKLKIAKFTIFYFLHLKVKEKKIGAVQMYPQDNYIMSV